MDEVLVRRLAGAAVLLALAFVLASLLPDAPAPVGSGERVVRYDLSTGRELDTSPEAPAQPAVKAPAEIPAAAKPAPRSAVQLQESLALGNLDAWYVQVGSFENQANARSVLVKLYGLGMPTTIQSVQVKKELWYRVRVGPYSAESKAHAALKAIRAQGYRGARIVHIDGAG